MAASALVAIAVAMAFAGLAVQGAPQGDPHTGDVPAADIGLVRYNATASDDQGYRFTYEQSNKQIFSEVGTLKESQESQNGSTARTIAVEGAFTFIAPDGQTHWVNYKADENGFVPQVGTGVQGGIQPGQDAPVAGDQPA